MEKIINVSLLILLTLTFFMCQQNINAQQVEGQIYTVVEQMPEYPGGTDALLKFIDANMKYPVEAKQKGVEGKVFVQLNRKYGNIPEHHQAHFS